jgi:hypothetical protein
MYSTKTTKRDISYFSWDFCAPDVNKSSLAELKWHGNAGWILPQLLALLGSKLPLAKVAGKYSATASLRATRDAIAEGQFTFSTGLPISMQQILGMFNVLNCSVRGDILATGWKQSSGDGMRYNASVPLILSAFKEYRNIGYSEWDWSDPNMKHLVDGSILDMAPYFSVGCSISKDDLLEFREVGRVIRSGSKMGTKRAIKSCTTLTGITDPDFNDLPRLLRLLLCQVWVYSPECRHKFAITNLMDLDTPAPLLVETDLIEEHPELQPFNPHNPWNL